MTEGSLDNPLFLSFFVCVTHVSRPILYLRSCNPYSERVCLLLLLLIRGLPAVQ